VSLPRVSYVIIGRNEERHLGRCLQSVFDQDYAGPREVHYVDSRSSDSSVDIARQFAGVAVHVVADDRPTAAKGRNCGWTLATGTLVQFVDGDAELTRGWTHAAVAAFEDPTVAAVFGWFDERRPEYSIYNRMADLDWPREQGDVTTFGGIVMVRRRCLLETGGFPEDTASGEEPVLALELRHRGHRILQLPVAMATHDIDLDDFGSYWRRCVETGVSLAEQIAGKRRLGASLWSLRTVKNAVAVTVVASVLLGGLAFSPHVWWIGAGIGGADSLRIAWRNHGRAGSWPAALAYAVHVRLIILAQMVGLLRWLARSPKADTVRPRADSPRVTRPIS